MIGLEVHVQLLTETKMFCGCPNRFGVPPNTHVCPVCLGYPGTLPVMNRHAVDLAVRLALALGCEVRETSIFARKNYFYPDLPKNYQISQYDRPLAEDGSARRWPRHDERQVRIERLHLEEDAGKMLHDEPGGGALRRQPGGPQPLRHAAGGDRLASPTWRPPPRRRTISRPSTRSSCYTGDAATATWRRGACAATPTFRCAARGETKLGTKAEVKNLNSFRNVAQAIEYEIERQIERARSRRPGRAGDPELRRRRRRRPGCMRSKEEAHDYRYFPEPDLPPLVVTAERIDGAAARSSPSSPGRAGRASWPSTACRPPTPGC